MLLIISGLHHPFNHLNKMAVCKRSSSSSSLSPIHPRNGFCNANSTFYSKRNPLPLPAKFLPWRHHIYLLSSSPRHHRLHRRRHRSVDNVADCLHHDMGIRRGDVVLILSPNSISIPLVCLSVMSLGAVVTTANPLNTASEISRQVADCNPKLAFATPEERVGSTLGVRVVGSLSEMTKKKPSEIRVRNRVNQDGTAMLLYSSGTTGRSKGVIISHGNLIAHVARYIAEPLEPNQTFLCTVPLFHTFGLLNYALATVALGSKVVILRKFDLHGMMAAVEKYRATTLVLVPPILVAMINGSDLIKAKYDLTSLKTVRSGGDLRWAKRLRSFSWRSIQRLIFFKGTLWLNQTAQELRQIRWRRVRDTVRLGCCRLVWKRGLWIRIRVGSWVWTKRASFGSKVPPSQKVI